MSNLTTDNPVALQTLMDETIFGNGFDFKADLSVHPLQEENSTHVQYAAPSSSTTKDTSYVAVGVGAEQAAMAIESGRVGDTVDNLEVLGGEFIYQGNKDQGILFILRYEQYPYFSPAALDAFEKTIGALKLTKETVAVLNLANPHNPNDFKRIMQFFQPTKIILLGVEPASLKLPFIEHNSYMKGRIATVFNTFSFEEMFVDVNKKKLFWNEFKTFIVSCFYQILVLNKNWGLMLIFGGVNSWKDSNILQREEHCQQRERTNKKLNLKKMLELVFATNNAHKLEEVQAIVGSAFIIKSLNDIDCSDDIPETGETFEENAKQKTDYLVNKYGLYCFGDDSGLEIDALNGEPGVYSARYSGSRDMEKNIDLVLQKLGDNTNRTARFKTVISLYLNEQQHFFEGSIEGKIIEERRGIDGFGYDPIFIPNGYDRTFAEMTAAEKNSISHRAIAVGKLATYLKTK